MPDPKTPNPAEADSCLRVGSLFSGYGGLDLAVEEVFDVRTVWFSEINTPVARVFAHHWPEAPNRADITTIGWSTVEPVDIVCGGFPCQDVSTVGKRAGLAPGTRCGLWAHMATAIEALQPEWVIAENVRGSCQPRLRVRVRKETPMNEHATPPMQPPITQPVAYWNPTRGIWETSQPDLYGRLVRYSAIWPTSGNDFVRYWWCVVAGGEGGCAGASFVNRPGFRAVFFLVEGFAVELGSAHETE